MSEYQYFEFQALERPLSREEQEQLRGLSSGADHRDKPHQHLPAGNFPGEPRRMVERYFDAHLYVTNGKRTG
ncbi:hypothetical protein ACFY1A_45515 [Streptomyces sp. NPDC001520]|uniref:hypothetical protein n=1 Tax=Streptomyces sp. NPDC001520 TaxID=3364581 RepID=UPI00367446E5